MIMSATLTTAGRSPTSTAPSLSSTRLRSHVRPFRSAAQASFWHLFSRSLALTSIPGGCPSISVVEPSFLCRPAAVASALPPAPQGGRPRAAAGTRLSSGCAAETRCRLPRSCPRSQTGGPHPQTTVRCRNCYMHAPTRSGQPTAASPLLSLTAFQICRGSASTLMDPPAGSRPVDRLQARPRTECD